LKIPAKIAIFKKIVILAEVAVLIKQSMHFIEDARTS